jgi:chemotaxis protein MotB
MNRRRRRRASDHAAEHADERWLLTYADMITLLMALFMVMFAMSTVDTKKLKGLQESLHDALSAKIMPGGQAIQETAAQTHVETPAPVPMTTSAPPQHKIVASAAQKAAEMRNLEQAQQEIQRQAEAMGLSTKVSTQVTERGLVIQILTDGLLFDSGHAQIKPAGFALLEHLAPLLRRQSNHHMVVEGHTDSLPIRSSTYPSNWELSTARASAVVRALIAMRLPPEQMEAAGRAYLQPIAANTTDAGRSKNRRVEIVLPRTGS